MNAGVWSMRHTNRQIHIKINPKSKLYFIDTPYES